jgi:outer membrane protein TolC
VCVPHIFVLSFLLSTAGPRCGPVDVETALALASANGDEVAIRRSEQAAALADLSLARAARWIPIASATFLAGPSPEAHGTVTNPTAGSSRSIAGLSPFFRIDTSVVQPLFTWGRLDAAEEAARAGVRARDLLLQDTTSQVQLRVIQLFWGETLARQILGIAAEVEKSLLDVDKKIDKAIADGSEEVKPSDRYKLDLYKAELRRRKADAQKGLESAHAGLAASLAVLPEQLAVQELPMPVPLTDVPDVATARGAAERQRPDVAALDQAIAARTAEVKATSAARLPQLFLGGTFAFSYAPNRDIQTNPWVSDYFNTLGGGVGLGIRQDLAFPVLTAQVAKARAERATLERQREGLGRLVQVQVESAVADLKAAAERFQAAKAALRTAKTWFRSASLDFAAGIAEAKDLIEAYGAYVESQVSQAQATYELVVGRARLEQVTGAAPRRYAASCTLP